MAEIKSTLDLVLERTRNLTMTEQEKSSLEHRELEGKLRGWVKKYLDGAMQIPAVKAGMAAIPEIRRNAARDLFRNLIREHIGVQGDNTDALNLLEEVLEESPQPYLDAIDHCRGTLAAEQSRFENVLKQALAGQGISGSAVVPNLDLDDAWRISREKTLADFRLSLNLIGRDS
jgi:hypothetical protein